MTFRLKIFLLLVLLAACTKTTEEPTPEPSPKPKPIPGKTAEPYDTCGIEEKTGKGLPKSSLNSTLSVERARMELDGFNELCGDVWCEGSFEYFFHGLRCDEKKKLCHLDVRMYDRKKTEKKVEGLKKTGKGFVAHVLFQKSRRCCTHPGISDKIMPCTTFDARCELKTKVGKDEFPMAFHDTMSNCIRALEDGIRKIVPEFDEESD